jgi:hypothetical protein
LRSWGKGGLKPSEDVVQIRRMLHVGGIGADRITDVVRCEM